MDTTLSRMDATFRRTMTSVTDQLFPMQRGRDIQKQQIIKKHHQYVTSLPLQMALYFHSFYFPLWIIGSTISLELKWDKLDNLYKIVLVAVYLVLFVIEIIRLYIGYLGNLMERVPELAGSWLITVLISSPLIILLLFLNNSTTMALLERALHIVQALFVFFEVIFEYFAIRTMVRYQVTKFNLQQFSDMDDMSHVEGRYSQ